MTGSCGKSMGMWAQVTCMLSYESRERAHEGCCWASTRLLLRDLDAHLGEEGHHSSSGKALSRGKHPKETVRG